MQTSTEFIVRENTIKIINDISEFMNRHGGDCSEWHVGVATDLEREMFVPGIPRNHPGCLCRCAVSAQEAEAIVRGFMNLSCQGNLDGRSGGGESAVYVVAYRKPAGGDKTAIKGAPPAPPNRLFSEPPANRDGV